MSPVDRGRAGGLGAYLSVFARALAANMAYSVSVWINLAAMAVGFGFTLLVWTYARGGQAADPGFFAYLTLAFAANFALSIAFERYVGERIREGLIATDLLKPVDYTWLFFWQALSDGVFQAFFALVVLAVAALKLGGALAPASSLAAAQGLASLLLAFLVQFHLGFLFIQMIFATHSNYGPFTTRMALHTAFSGVFAPLDIYQGLLGRIAQWLPFRHVIYTPCAIWLGRLSGADAWRGLAQQALWALGLALLSRLSFNLIRRHLTIQGG